MKIAVNTRLLLKNKLEGIGWFTYEALKRITANHPEHEFIFIFDRPWNEEFIFSDNITPIQIGPPSRHPFLWYLWFEKSLPKVLKQYKPDLFLSPDGYLSLNSDFPALPVIHDINFEHYPKDLPFWYRKYYQYYFPKYANKATRIATVSDFSKSDISQKYKVAADKIDVVFNGVSDRFKPIVEESKKQAKAKFSNNQPYFVFVGSIHPRKNISKMLLAFDQFKSSGNYPHQLVIIGQKKWWTSEMESTLHKMSFKEGVLFKNSVSPEEVALAVAGSDGMLYISNFEGFGIPIIEAMKSGVPVITSNVTSMPDVAGNAALLCNPKSKKEIAEQMKRLVHEPGLSDSLIKKGLIRANDFSWDKTAELLWESILKSC
ncbi:MAG: glycosyltransferase family 4 protein [Salibacteraceae bacterium]